MFVEELTRIKESEREADTLQRTARSDSKQLLEEARTRAAATIEAAENEAKDLYQSLLAEGKAQADEEYERAMEESRLKCRNMIEAAEQNRKQAVDFIVERIVGNRVDY